MIKRDLVKEDVVELAHSVVWREFSDYYANAQCDELTDRLTRKLMLALEEFIDNEHQRREHLEKEAEREREVQVYG